MKISKIKKILEADLKLYKSQNNVKRNRESSGFDKIIVASDQDLDQPYGASYFLSFGKMTEYI